MMHCLWCALCCSVRAVGRTGQALTTSPPLLASLQVAALRKEAEKTQREKHVLREVRPLPLRASASRGGRLGAVQAPAACCCTPGPPR